MDMQTMLQRYARLMVETGMNIQPGQVVNIITEPIHRDLALLVAQEAYRKKAKHVHVELAEPRLTRVRVQGAATEDLSFVPDWFTAKFAELTDRRGALMRILGEEDPDVCVDLPAKALTTIDVSERRARKYFYDNGIGRAQVHWSIAGAATPKWGQKVFPGLEPAAAAERLWGEIFRICRVDHEDFLERWVEHDRTLQARAKKLTELKLKTLHFQGPGTDLRIGLSERARFKGGPANGPYGQPYNSNIPTEEVYTAPDWRKTSGKVRVTRPVDFSGRVVDGLEIEFENGEVSRFSAREGAEMFGEFIHSDPGACRLGELALVGIDSPIYQSGLIFHEVLFDENAACHIAVGNSFLYCLEGGAAMSQAELDALGFNSSATHKDMMISSEEVDVSAETYGGETVPLLRKGKWVLPS